MRFFILVVNVLQFAVIESVYSVRTPKCKWCYYSIVNRLFRTVVRHSQHFDVRFFFLVIQCIILWNKTNCNVKIDWEWSAPTYVILNTLLLIAFWQGQTFGKSNMFNECEGNIKKWCFFLSYYINIFQSYTRTGRV